MTSTTSRPITLLSTPILDSKCYRYAEDVLSGEILASKKVKLASQRFIDDLESQSAKGYRWKFDIEKAYRPIDFKEKFMLPTKGDYDTMTLLPWQHFTTGNIYGWVDKKTGLRRFKEALEIVARGNGKTTNLAGDALYGASKDGERGADVYLLANAKEQAKILFDEVSANISSGSILSKHFRKTLTAIYYDSSNSKIQHRASDSRKLDGLNAHIAIFDEIHEFLSFKLINVIKRSMNKRRQPLIIYISTLGSQLDGPLMHLYQLGSNILTNPESINESVRDRMFVYIAEIDEDDNPDNADCWIKANPSLGMLLDINTLKDDWNRAKLIPAERADFINKQLNVFTALDEMSFLDYETIKRNNDIIDIEPLVGRDCYGGFDISSSEDFTAANLQFPLDDGRFFMLNHTWIPERKVLLDNEKLDYYGMQKDGLLTIVKGDYVKKEQVRDWFIEQSKKFNICSIGYDPAHAYQLVEDLRLSGLSLNAIRQGALTLTDPMNHMKELYLDGRIVSNSNRLLNWFVGNVKLIVDRNGNRMPTKQNRYRKIDGFMAMLNGLAEYMNLNPTSLERDNRDIVTVINLD